jgi:hypothetical protein
MWFEPGLEVPILEVPIGDTSLEGLSAIRHVLVCSRKEREGR